MIIVSVSYPKNVESRFDHEYYLRQHTPLLKKLWTSLGMEKVELLRGVSALDGGQPPFEMCALLHFTSQEALKQALAAFGAEIIADIANYTNVQPVIQINQPIA